MNFESFKYWDRNLVEAEWIEWTGLVVTTSTSHWGAKLTIEEICYERLVSWFECLPMTETKRDVSFAFKWSNGLHLRFLLHSVKIFMKAIQSKRHQFRGILLRVPSKHWVLSPYDLLEGMRLQLLLFSCPTVKQKFSKCFSHLAFHP